jgi:hypothetical protein
MFKVVVVYCLFYIHLYLGRSLNATENVILGSPAGNYSINAKFSP